jgi:hypothetical protein
MISRNQNGQTLIIVLSVMAIALLVGISASTRFLSTLRNLARTDSSSRALAVAEAGVERMLALDIEVLRDYVNYSTCGEECEIEIIGEDGVRAFALVSLSLEGETSDPYPVDIKTTDSYEVNLVGYPSATELYVCWNDPSSGYAPSIEALHYYGSLGSYSVESYAYNSVVSYFGDNGFDNALPAYGFSNCFTVAGVQNPQSLRVRSLYNDVTVHIIAGTNAIIPYQGILIVSEGTVSEATRRVAVVKRDPVVPVDFDYILYSKSETEPLAN